MYAARLPQSLSHDPLIRDDSYDTSYIIRPHLQCIFINALISDNFLLNGVIMLNFISKKMTVPVLICFLSVLLTPVLAQAELGGSGSTAARDAAEQRAARERKLEKKKLKDAEAKKAGETQQGQPAETQQPAEPQQEKPAAQ